MLPTPLSHYEQQWPCSQRCWRWCSAWCIWAGEVCRQAHRMLAKIQLGQGHFVAASRSLQQMIQLSPEKCAASRTPSCSNGVLQHRSVAAAAIFGAAAPAGFGLIIRHALRSSPAAPVNDLDGAAKRLRVALKRKLGEMMPHMKSKRVSHTAVEV